MSMGAVAGIAGGVLSSGVLTGGGGGGGGAPAPMLPSNVKFAPVAFKSSGTGNTAKSGGKVESGAAANSAPVSTNATSALLLPFIAVGAAVALLFTLLRKK